MQNPMIAFLTRSLKMQHKEIAREIALEAAGNLNKFFAIELMHQGKPLRLIVAASDVPDVLALPTVAGGEEKTKCGNFPSSSNQS